MLLRLIALVPLAFIPACGTERVTTTSPAPTPQPVSSSLADDDGIYTLQAASLDGERVDLSQFAGRVSLVVNVASNCGYTAQYQGLQKLHDDLKDRGFQVLGFPCNDFGGQEPGTADTIRSFCTDRFGVTFPMFDKVVIRGGDRSPVYERLIAASGKQPNWNFCKFLVGKDGKVLGVWQSSTTPDDAALRAAIDKAL